MDDVLKFLMVGARAVQIGTANFVDPYSCDRLIQELEAFLQAEGIADVNEIIGSLVIEGAQH